MKNKLLSVYFQIQFVKVNCHKFGVLKAVEELGRHLIRRKYNADPGREQHKKSKYVGDTNLKKKKVRKTVFRKSNCFKIIKIVKFRKQIP